MGYTHFSSRFGLSIERTNYSAKNGVGVHMGAMNDRLRKLVLLLGGNTGSFLLSAVALGVAAAATSCTGDVAYEMLAAVVLLRLVYVSLHRPSQFLCSYSIRTRLSSVFKDEGQMSILFLAAAYALQWSGVQPTIVTFLGVNFLLQMGLVFFCRTILGALRKPAKTASVAQGKQRVLVVGTGSQAQDIVDSILTSPEMGISIRGFLDYHKTGLWRYRDIPLLGHPDRVNRICAAGQVDAVILAVEAEDTARSRQLFATCEKMGIPVCVVLDSYKHISMTAQPTHLNGTPALLYRTFPSDHWSLLVKNIVDKVGAVVGLILSAPLMLLAAMAIKIDSKGPVLFKQKRCGLNGRQFSLYKLRTMCSDAEKKKGQVQQLNMMSGPVFKAKKDPRVTRVGRHLRKWSVDEIPQFLNVLRGQMSLVGPRPPLPEEVTRYESWQHRRLSVKPGVTCLWQVNGRNHVDFDEWMRLDLQYIDNWSPWLDAKILAKTLPAVIKGTGAS
jgi:exopolysaccharide biosynthesis polyprenyl glycosylphosphotransferase